MFLIQLPDTLPGQGNQVIDVKQSEEKAATSTEENEQDKPAENNFCLMKGLQEGLVGKFLRFKSGKTKLVLGNTRFDADLGLDPGFLQEVVSIRTNPNERNGDMINLGKINAKVNVSPDWEEMFQAINWPSCYTTILHFYYEFKIGVLFYIRIGLRICCGSPVNISTQINGKVVIHLVSQSLLNRLVYIGGRDKGLGPLLLDPDLFLNGLLM